VILVDTSVWVDHLRAHDRTLVQLLHAEQVLTHPFVIGELALGSLPERGQILDALRLIPQAVVASHQEVLHFIASHELFGFGIGYVDAHLLAATRLTAGATLWTRDKRLHRVAERSKLAATLPR
jgi:predicted nucleic acid-binding protein